MARIIAILCALCLAFPATGAPQAPRENADFFTVTAKQVTEALRKQILDAFRDQNRNAHSKREQGEEGGEGLVRPELHFSTLRAEASGSGIPSPTMFVGGFSFMMMPTPEGEQIFNRIMESLPNLPGKK